MSVNNVSPQSFMGGTWVAWGAGRVPVGVNTSDSSFNTVEKTGGEKTHTLTNSEIPNYGFGVAHVDGADSKFVGITNVTHTTNTSASSGNYRANGAEAAQSSWRHDFTFGGGGAHNNLQPYITCYMWKRTA